MYPLIGSSPSFLDTAAPVIFRCISPLLGYTFTSTFFSSTPHTGFLSSDGYSRLQGFLCSDVPSDYKQTAATRKGRRKNKGCTIVYLHWQQPSKHRYIKTSPEEQWLCHQEQATYGTQCFIVGLFPVEGHIYHLKLDKTFPWQMQVKVTHSNLPKLAFCWIRVPNSSDFQEDAPWPSSC